MNTQWTNPKRGLGWLVKAFAMLALVFVISTLGAGALARSNLIKRYPAPGQLVDVGGYKMHLYCTG